MKKFIPFALAAVLLLTACGTAAQQTEESPAAVEQTAAPLPDAGLTDAKTENSTEAESSNSVSVALEKAKTYIDKDLSELVAEFGEPESEEYASSCLGPGEDGMLTYSDFVVYTYKEGDQETVTDVDVD